MIYKEAYIFDMDGTLIDNMHFQYEAWRQFFSFHKGEMTFEEVKRRTAVGIPRKIVAKFFDNSLKDEEIPVYLDQKEEFFQDLYRRHIKPIKGLPEFLEKTALNNIPIALATGSDYRNINFTFDELNIRKYFKVVVSADNVRRGKPDPESFVQAAARLGVKPENCLVFEDSLGGIEAAQRAGMQIVALTTMHSREELVNLPGVLMVIDDYTSVELNNLSRAAAKYFTHA